MKLIWSPEAVDDLSDVRAYISEENSAAARDVVLTILRFIELHLPAYPNSGRPGRVAGTRELVVPDLPFIIPYRIQGQSIEILRVYHAARRWPERF